MTQYFHHRDRSQPVGRRILAQAVSIGGLLCLMTIGIFLTSCSQSLGETSSRVFKKISIEYIGEYQLPKNSVFKNTSVGGLSGLTYDRQKDLYYVVSDDRSEKAPARFYTLKLKLDTTNPEQIQFQQVDITDVTFLKEADGKQYEAATIDPEAIALTPEGTVFISSEGHRDLNVLPFLKEFDLKTGIAKKTVPIPLRYLPDSENKRGMQKNLAFEGITLSPTGTLPASGEPLRLFAATESALTQDKEIAQLSKDGKLVGSKNRWLHYLITDKPELVSEHLYQLDPPPVGAIAHGLSEIQSIDTSGNFLTLERSVGLLGFRVKLFQASTAGATDTTNIVSFNGNKNIQPIQKQLAFDLKQLNIYIDNLEGMALGARLPDGSQSLLLVSDNNFINRQITQFLLFKLKQG